MTPEVFQPTSRGEAAAAYGDGRDVTVVGGGTILVPEINAGRLSPTRALLLSRSGLDTLVVDDGTIRVGATCPLTALDRAPEPLRSAAREVADQEIRGQATLGGNLCAPPGADAPRGDLRAPLVALAARVRSA
ncbi:MAG: FAD binding domain-containing protein, partial [Streptosporangiaceae bacterium]